MSDALQQEIHKVVDNVMAKFMARARALRSAQVVVRTLRAEIPQLEQTLTATHIDLHNAAIQTAQCSVLHEKSACGVGHATADFHRALRRLQAHAAGTDRLHLKLAAQHSQLATATVFLHEHADDALFCCLLYGPGL
ncbi:TPA: hypothetical protein ACH3X1_002589 [Trebouxia sp. C0004]